MNLVHRTAGALLMDKPVPISVFEPPEDTTFTLSSIALDVQLQDAKSKSRPGGVAIDAAELALQASKAFSGHVYRRGQQMFLKYHQGEADECVVKLTVKDMEFVDIGRGADGAGAVSGGGGGAGARAPSAVGQLIKVTTVQIAKAAHKDNENLKLTGSSSGKAVKIIDKGFNFGELGIGGLDAQFQEIFRRAFASRMVPPAVLKKMGQTHVRGMLLYGPPGCGKTLIARKLAQALHAAPPKIVNGPEILNKYVGASEEAVRALFKEAEAEQAEKGDDSELHIIILDEMDAILRSRGSTSGGTGVNDSVVNQFLSKIDGVEALNNILLIGMTNRKDMIDEAILRPGRLEIHVEIGLPDGPGRVQVLNIHTKALRANGMLAADVSIEDIAARAKNYTGAEMEGLVKAACSYLFARTADPANPDKALDFSAAKVTHEDFLRALSEYQPAFGTREEELAQLMEQGVIDFGEEFSSVRDAAAGLAAQVLRSERTLFSSLLFTGPAGSGKSALAASIARAAGFPFAKRISGASLLNKGDGERAAAVQRVFLDAYKSPASIVIIDDIERVIEFVGVGLRFSNPVLQTLLVLVKAPPPPGHRLLLIGTTALPDMLESMEVTGSFQMQKQLQLLSAPEQFSRVLTVFEPTMAAAAVAELAARLASAAPLSIKKLLNILNQAKYIDSEAGRAGALTQEALLAALVEWGL